MRTETELIRRLSEPALSGKKIIVAIDGRCGSGKTTAAAALGAHFFCNVFHTDDFYLPGSEREIKRQQQGFANADIARLENEVLKNIQKGAPFTYYRYLPETGKYTPLHVQTPTRLNIVEGSFCTDASLRKYYGIKVFLTADIEVRKKRLRERGENVKEYTDKWMVYEENFFKAQDTIKFADVVFDTTGDTM